MVLLSGRDSYEETDKQTQPVLWKYRVWQIERQTSPRGSQDSSCEWPRCAQQVAGLYRSPGFGGAVAHCADCGHIKHIFMIERPYLGFTGSSDLLLCYLIWRFILLCIIIIKDQLRQHLKRNEKWIVITNLVNSCFIFWHASRLHSANLWASAQLAVFHHPELFL